MSSLEAENERLNREFELQAEEGRQRFAEKEAEILGKRTEFDAEINRRWKR